MASVRPNTLKAMPVPDQVKQQKRSRLESVQSNGDQAANNNDQNGNTDSNNQNGSGDLLDLADIFGSSGGQQQQQVNNSNSNSNSDILDIFGGGGGNPPAPQANSNDGNIMGLFGDDGGLHRHLSLISQHSKKMAYGSIFLSRNLVLQSKRK